jgi:CBS domain-containing protein
MSLDDRMGERVARAMRPEVATLSPELPLEEAARTIIANRVSGMPVVDGAGTVVGVISLTDILTAVVSPASETDRETTFYDPVRLDKLVGSLLDKATGDGRRVADAMSERIVTVSQDAPLRRAAQLMAKHRVHRVLVTDDIGQLVGILSAMDIVEIVSEG